MERQTRKLEVLVPTLRVCGFKSRLRHHRIESRLRAAFLHLELSCNRTSQHPDALRVIGQKVCPVSGHRRRSVPFSVLSAPACSTIRPLMHIFARWSTLGMPPCRSNYAVTWATLVKPQVSESRSNGMNRTPPSDPLCALSLGRPTSKIMHLARFLETRKGVVDCLLIMRLSDRG